MFSITRNQLNSLASVGHCAGTDTLTPILSQVKISGDSAASTITAVATDRYKVAELVFSDVEVTEDFEVLVSAKELLAAARTLKGGARDGHLTVFAEIVEAGSQQQLSITNYVTTVALPTFEGNYPPIERLFPEQVEELVDGFGGWAFNPTHFAALAKVVPPTYKASEMKGVAMRFQATGPIENPRRPGNVLVTWSGVEGFRGLLQPNLILS